MEKIAKAFPDLNVEWLLLGTGEMYRADTVTQNGHINQNGNGSNTVNGGEAGELIEMLKKRDEQIDRLISLLEKERNNEHK